MTDEQVKAVQSKTKFTSEYVTQKDLMSLLEASGHSDLFHEISENGFGSDLYRILKKSGKLYVPEVLAWAYIEDYG